MKVITSATNPLIRQLVRLEKSARERRENQLTLLDGVHLVRAWYEVSGLPEKLVVSESGYASAEIGSVLDELKAAESGRLVLLSDSLFDRLSPVVTPAGILALVKIPASETAVYADSSEASSLSVLLESIQDPGNLGSIIRSAAAAGARHIYLSATSADAWSPKTLRAAMGGHFLVQIHEQADLVRVAKTLPGRVIATVPSSDNSLYQSRLTGHVAFIFGNEGQGVSAELLQAADEMMTVPMAGSRMESLNVAAAAAVCFFERVRQIQHSMLNPEGPSATAQGAIVCG